MSGTVFGIYVAVCSNVTFNFIFKTGQQSTRVTITGIKC